MDFILIMISIIIVVSVVTAIVNRVDDTVQVKSARAVDSYDYIKYFKEDRTRIQKVTNHIEKKHKDEFKVRVNYTSPAGRKTVNRVMVIHLEEVSRVQKNPALIMSATEYNQITRAQREYEKNQERLLKEELKKQEKAQKEKLKAENELKKQADRERERQEKEQQKRAERERIQQERNRIKAEQETLLNAKRQEYYNKVNELIDYSSNIRTKILIEPDIAELDRLVGELYERAYGVVKKVKDVNSGEWNVFDIFMAEKFEAMKVVVDRSQRILDYYESPEFAQIREACNSLMNSQREFNEYIDEKAQSIAKMFGSRVVRNETDNIYKQNYFRPYKKTITPFTVEVTKAVFSSAENDPIEYIIRKFYPNKNSYPEQIQRLQMLIGELETLKEAKTIIDNYKKDYSVYLTDVPAFVMANDEDGFYKRLGFADISERTLSVEYRFSYTSDGGMVQKSFQVPMTEETITDLIERLESKLTTEAFTIEQRALMTQKLREKIKIRDDYTCKMCGNSTIKEPNLLLEVDHILPVSKGGRTTEENLQTLCWKCNRTKSNKILKENC